MFNGETSGEGAIKRALNEAEDWSLRGNLFWLFGMVHGMMEGGGALSAHTPSLPSLSMMLGFPARGPQDGDGFSTGCARATAAVMPGGILPTPCLSCLSCLALELPPAADSTSVPSYRPWRQRQQLCPDPFGN